MSAHGWYYNFLSSHLETHLIIKISINELRKLLKNLEFHHKQGESKKWPGKSFVDLSAFYESSYTSNNNYLNLPSPTFGNHIEVQHGA